MLEIEHSWLGDVGKTPEKGIHTRYICVIERRDKGIITTGRSRSRTRICANCKSIECWEELITL